MLREGNPLANADFQEALPRLTLLSFEVGVYLDTNFKFNINIVSAIELSDLGEISLYQEQKEDYRFLSLEVYQ